MENKLVDFIRTNRIPLLASLQLTYRCNFKCIHCYQTPIRKNLEEEIKTEQWYSIIDQLKNKGCILITFMGGEIFLKKDFIDIYKYAYNKNLKIRISTNASHISKENMDILSKYKPMEITTTLYGFSEETYSKFTGINKMFDKVKNNIIEFAKRDINIQVKVIANILNKKEIIQMKDFCKSIGADFNVYYTIKCFSNGDCTPRKIELNSNDKVVLMKDLGLIHEYMNIIKNEHFENGIKKCSAGISEAYIDYTGSMFLCNSSCENKWSLLKNDFDFCWRKMYEERKKKIEIITPCSSCNLKNICGLCAPSIKTEYKEICTPIKSCTTGKELKNLLDYKLSN